MSNFASRALPPDGEYVVQAVDAVFDNADSKKPVLVRFEIISAAHYGYRFSSDYHLMGWAAERGRTELARLAIAVKAPPFPLTESIAALCFTPFEATLKNKYGVVRICSPREYRHDAHTLPALPTESMFKEVRGKMRISDDWLKAVLASATTSPPERD
jgi:hypothetical protein